MQEYYKILNIKSTASDEEVLNAYNTLKDKYLEERFLEGEKGNEAAKNLTKIETAYHEIMTSRNELKEEEGYKDLYSEIEKLIKEGNINEAQNKLDDFTDRNAEWHYLQSVVFYKKKWTNESKKQLEISVNMEPYNPKYTEAYEKLKKQIEFNQNQFHSGNAYYNNNQYENQNRQMGAGDNSCFNFCATWCCMELMCSMCCR